MLTVSPQPAQELAAALTAAPEVLDLDGPPTSVPPANTRLFAPAECRQHLTAPEPIRRGGPPPPPENVNRLRVLTDPGAEEEARLAVGNTRPSSFLSAIICKPYLPRNLQIDLEPGKATSASQHCTLGTQSAPGDAATHKERACARA